MYNPYDYYFKKAQKSGYKARSVFKLEEIDKKFKIIDKNIENVLDIGCSPGSWIQYVHKNLILYKKDFKIVGIDILPTKLNLKNVYIYQQDIKDFDKIKNIIHGLGIYKFDLILSDMAPNTIGLKDLDAIKCISLIEKTLPIYEKFFSKKGKFVVKVFMGPGFDEFVLKMKNIYGSKSIKIYKPASTRKNSKEVYIIKI